MEKANKERGKGEEVSRCFSRGQSAGACQGEDEGESYDGVVPGTSGALPHTSVLSGVVDK